MNFLNEGWYITIVISHIIATVAAVGTVTVTDYLHLVGLRNKVREKKLLFVYPLLSKAILFFILLIIISGSILVANRPELLATQLFRVKLVLFSIVLINGAVLHGYVSKKLDVCIIKGGLKHCTREVLLVSALSGSVSLTTWYGILILSLTKDLNYSPAAFVSIYLGAVFLLFVAALISERKARQWEDLV